eukprot:m.626141 g.626141  ORF g.626141 m.626141 type:complete len:59 (+) comp22551_c0_seq1:41-217(+)
MSMVGGGWGVPCDTRQFVRVVPQSMATTVRTMNVTFLKTHASRDLTLPESSVGWVSGG